MHSFMYLLGCSRRTLMTCSIPTLKPPALFLWGHLKSLAYSTPIQNVEGSKNRIMGRWRTIRIDSTEFETLRVSFGNKILLLSKKRLFRNPQRKKVLEYSHSPVFFAQFFINTLYKCSVVLVDIWYKFVLSWDLAKLRSICQNTTIKELRQVDWQISANFHLKCLFRYLSG